MNRALAFFRSTFRCFSCGNSWSFEASTSWGYLATTTIYTGYTNVIPKDMPLSVDDIYSDLGDANPSNLMLMKMELTITSSWIQDGYGSSFVDCAAGSAKQGNATVTE